MSEEKEGSGLKNIKIEPQNVFSPNVQTTVFADNCKVMIDHDLQMCTFVFFQIHPKPKSTGRGLEIEGTNEESFLEIKIPFNSAFGVVEYMHRILQEIQQKKLTKGYNWGPTAIHQDKKND